MFIPEDDDLDPSKIKNYIEYKNYFLQYGSENVSTSIGRFNKRVIEWNESSNGYLRHHFWWMVHNCVAHPILGLVPCKKTVDFHDWTSENLNTYALPWLKNNKRSPMPVIKNKWKWLKHNVFSHIAIGLVPCMRTFYFHDSSALEMNVPEWR